MRRYRVRAAFPLKQSTTIVWVGGSIVHAIHGLLFELDFFLCCLLLSFLCLKLSQKLKRPDMSLSKDDHENMWLLIQGMARTMGQPSMAFCGYFTQCRGHDDIFPTLTHPVSTFCISLR